MIGFLLNGLIFIVIGLQLPGILNAISGDSLRTLIYDALLICVAVVLARIAWVIAGVYLPRLLSKKIREREPEPRWQNVALVAWAGMRGVISLAAAFALPFTLPDGRPFPARNYILFFTFCVILATLVGQGLTLPFLIRKLGIKDDGATDEEERSARLAANKAAIAFIENASAHDGTSPELLQRLRAEYDDRIAQLCRCGMETDNPSGSVATPQYQQLQQQALSTERDTIIQLRNKHVINDEALRRIQRDLDLAEVRLVG
jgi:CPA1 family monovalent cation:H+ antiporter